MLVTEANGAAPTGVELRTPELSLMTVARITVPGGAMPASGWNERFDHVAGVLNLPPGHRLLAAFGADSAPGSWVERWGLLDLFLLALRYGDRAAALRMELCGCYICRGHLGHQDNQLLVWLILFVLLSLVSIAVGADGVAAIAGHVGPQSLVRRAARDLCAFCNHAIALRALSSTCGPRRFCWSMSGTTRRSWRAPAMRVARLLRRRRTTHRRRLAAN